MSCADCKAISEPVAACPCHMRLMCRDCATAHFEVTGCPGCERPMLADELWVCDVCDAPFCRDCLSRCDGPCDRMLCPGDQHLGICEDDRAAVGG
jgi:hypothetical protein